MEPARYLYKICKKNSSSRYHGMIVCANSADDALLYHPNQHHYANLSGEYWYIYSKNGLQIQSNQEDKLFEYWVSGTITDEEYRFFDQIDINWVKVSEIKDLDLICLGIAAPYLPVGIIAIINEN